MLLYCHMCVVLLLEATSLVYNENWFSRSVFIKSHPRGTKAVTGPHVRQHKTLIFFSTFDFGVSNKHKFIISYFIWTLIYKPQHRGIKVSAISYRGHFITISYHCFSLKDIRWNMLFIIWSLFHEWYDSTWGKFPPLVSAS